jgi:hypothetical protein
VTSGRSLRLVEERTSGLRSIVTAAWIAIVIAVGFASIAAVWLWPRTAQNVGR